MRHQRRNVEDEHVGTGERVISVVTRCESCGLPVHSYRYCAYCTDANGDLMDFDDRLTSMTEEWQAEHGHLTVEDARQAAREYMASMPAWRNHPRVVGVRRQPSSDQA